MAKAPPLPPGGYRHCASSRLHSRFHPQRPGRQTTGDASLGVSFAVQDFEHEEITTAEWDGAIIAAYAAPGLHRGVCSGACSTRVGAARRTRWRWWSLRIQWWNARRRIRRPRRRTHCWRTFVLWCSFWRHAVCSCKFSRVPSSIGFDIQSWFHLEPWIPWASSPQLQPLCSQHL